jgi:hypothetical protein
MRGIKGLKGRDPIGAVLTVGIKHREKGYPIEKDRFHIVLPREDNGVRHYHPAFESFNHAQPEDRKVIRGNLVHAGITDCFEYHLKAQVLMKAHPDRKPCCIGDGKNAERWMGGEPDNFQDIKCLNELCEFRQKTIGRNDREMPPLCMPWMRVAFRLRWKDGSKLPTPLVKYNSKGWNTTANFKGFFDLIAENAKHLGLETYTLFGFPFIMTLADQTKASSKTRFPVVTITPEIDPIEFFMRQREQLKALADYQPECLTDGTQQEAEVVYDDNLTVSRGKAVQDKLELE